MGEPATDADDFALQVEEAVALKAILGGDFTLLTSGGRSIEPERLIELPNCRDGSIGEGEFSYEVSVKLRPPEEGLVLELAGGICTGHRISHLPPLLLTLTLPRTYPSEAIPSVTLATWWLSADHCAQLEAELHLQSKAEKGSAVCYGLVSWLEASALQYIGMQSVLTCFNSGLDPDSHENITSAPTSSRQQGDATTSSERLFQSLLRYNAYQEKASFSDGIWTCNVCLEEVPGSQCIRAAACQHIFCKTCIKKHCKTQLEEKRVDLLRCPDPLCKEDLIRERVKKLLPEKDILLWEEAELQAALMKMSDIVFCPRCGATCIEDADNSALCPSCHYSFCSLCQSGYHPGQRCMPVETKLRLLKERMSGRKDGPLLRELKRREEDLLSISCVQKMSKPCPTCSAAISRTEGCNKVTCIYCGTYLCYTCGQQISGYDHFRAGGNCVLFDEEELRRWDQQFEPIDMQEQERLLANGEVNMPVARCARCRCGCLNPKLDKLNLLTCRGCSARYCYLCQTLLRKGEAATHFRPSGCRLHSND